MDQDQQVEDDLGDPEGIRRSGSGLRLAEEVHHPVDPEDPVEPHYDRAGDLLEAAGTEQKIGEVRREDTEEVEDVGGILQVVLPQ